MAAFAAMTFWDGDHAGPRNERDAGEGKWNVGRRG
jgi:hypothetical protein